MVKGRRLTAVTDKQIHELGIGLTPLHPETALRLHVLAELGLNPGDKPSPWVAAFSSFFTFGTGALLPLAAIVILQVLAWCRALSEAPGDATLTAGEISGRRPANAARRASRGKESSAVAAVVWGFCVARAGEIVALC